MSKKEYLDRLEKLLADLPQEERQAAMEYYTDYLEDAGPEGEKEAMEHLGSPEKVAAAVREGIKSDGTEGRWTESGYENSDAHKEFQPVQTRRRRRERSGRGILWVLIIAVGMICLGIPILATAASVLLTLAAVAAAVSFGGFALVLGLAVAGIVLLALGIARLMVLPATGVMLAGGGFICLALAFVFLVPSVWIFGRVVPGIFNGIGWVFRRMFGRGDSRK